MRFCLSSFKLSTISTLTRFLASFRKYHFRAYVVKNVKFSNNINRRRKNISGSNFVSNSKTFRLLAIPFHFLQSTFSMEIIFELVI